MPVSIVSTNQVPAELKQEFNVYKVTTLNGNTALKCEAEGRETPFYLSMAGGDDETAPFLHITTFRNSCFDATEIIEETEPVYPFKASDMPEKVQGMINMAEQWLINLYM